MTTDAKNESSKTGSPKKRAGITAGMGDGDQLRGIANLFEKEELKKFIAGYFLMMGIVEGLIVFAAWVGYLWSKEAVFPWKALIIAVFTTPVAITFLFAVIIVGFNKYMFERREAAEGANNAATAGEGRFQHFLQGMRQVPFLIALLLLVISAGIIYKIDAIALFIAEAGEKAAQYLFISLATVLGVAVVVGMVWMALSYRLRRQKLDLHYRYRQEVMERLGLVILDDDTVIDREGRVVNESPADAIAHQRSREAEITLIPRLPNR